MTFSPNWNEYTNRLVTNKGVTATDYDLLNAMAGSRVLDLGCGIGRHLAGLPVPPVTLPVGIEMGIPALRYAKENFPSIFVLQATVYKLPFEDGFFDFVFGIDVIEHFEFPLKAMREAYRVCKKNGKLYIQTPNYPAKRVYDLWKTMRGTRRHFADDPTHVSRFSFWKLQQTIRRAGFIVERTKSRNVVFDESISFLKKTRDTTLGKILGQKTILTARK
jgi:SAM-dependent methyltransferase